MKQQDIEIERTEAGIFAYIVVLARGKSDKVTLWSKVGPFADQYKDTSDDEIQKIAFDRWKLLETSRLRRKKQ